MIDLKKYISTALMVRKIEKEHRELFCHLTYIGQYTKIFEEVNELLRDKSCQEEKADVVITVIGYRRFRKISVRSIFDLINILDVSIEEVLHKWDINKSRIWRITNGIYHHEEEEEHEHK